MLVGAEAFEAYRHTGHSGFVVAFAGSTWPAVVLESCRTQHEVQAEGRQWVQEALRERLQVMECPRRLGRSHRQKVRGHSSMPSNALVRSASRPRRRTDLNEILALGLGDKRLQFGSSEGVNETGL